MNTNADALTAAELHAAATVDPDTRRSFLDAQAIRAALAAGHIPAEVVPTMEAAAEQHESDAMAAAIAHREAHARAGAAAAKRIRNIRLT